MHGHVQNEVFKIVKKNWGEFNKKKEENKLQNSNIA